MNSTKSLKRGYPGIKVFRTMRRQLRLAKEGATEVPSNQFTAVPFSVGKKLIRSIWN